MADTNSGIEKETIPFYSNQGEKDTKTIEIKYTLSGSYFKLQLPIFKQGNAEESLHFIHKFLQAKTKLGYNTCAKLESGLEQLLQGNSRQEWNTIKSTVSPQSHTLASLDERILAFKRLYIPDPSAVDIQKIYIQNIRKNDKLTVSQFLDRLKQINMLIAQFPTATETDIFSPIEIKKIFYHAMLNRWRTNFINSGQNVQQASLDELQTYMVSQESQTDAHRKKVRDSNKKNQNKKPFNRSYKGYKHNRRYNSSNHKTSENKDHKNSKKLSNDDDCTIHGAGHKCTSLCK